MEQKSDSEWINGDLDTVLSGKFANEYIIFDTIRGTLERYGIKLPPMQSTGESATSSTFEFEGLDGAYLYIATKKDINGHFDAYAQVVDEDELDALEDMDISTEPLPNTSTTSQFLLRNRHCNDDSGNSDEY